eukprot:1378621-Pleurochrysis_carterae.AAC.1
MARKRGSLQARGRGSVRVCGCESVQVQAQGSASERARVCEHGRAFGRGLDREAPTRQRRLRNKRA